MLKKVALAAAASAALFSNAALAGSASGTLNVTATITAACAFAASTPVAFGNVLTTTSAVPSTGALSLTCTNLLPYTVSIDDGANPAVTGTHPRRMKDSATGNFLNYQIYTDAGRTIIVDSVAASNVFDTPTGAGNNFGTGNGSAQTITVYGQIPVQTTPPAGSFTDTLNVQVNF